ncbi:hypothetical protein [Plantactinospora sp. GCM10030261]|uniref:hypothetical protein n=1 Tax=Plantactinospora sp. GCM10030261 TaxID=3273420 RepID=UPI003610821B
MYVRLASAWTDRSGAVYAAGDMVDIDAVTLAELEEQGVVEEVKSGDGKTEKNDPERIGPGPTAPPKDDSEIQRIGPGPTAPPRD